jgi:type IV pilus assembly protein PilM
MSLFGKKKEEKNYLGVDIGGSSVKMVELKNNKGRAQLLTFGYLERSTKSTKESLLDNPTEMAEAIKKVAERAKVTSKDVVTALPASAVFSTILNLNEVTPKDVNSIKKMTLAVEGEAKKVLPLPIEEMVLDWKVLNPEAFKVISAEEDDSDIPTMVPKSVQVLLTAAAKSLVKQYIDIFKKAGMNLLSLETESFAMARTLVGKDKSPVVIIDIGAANTDIMVVDNGLPVMQRSVDVGGYNLSVALSEAMGITLDQAEQFKRDLGNYDGPIDVENIVPPIIERILQPIVNEVKFLLQFFHEQSGNEQKRIDRIILSGGTAKIMNIDEYFTNIFNIRAFPGDPFARVIYADDLRPLLDNIGSRLAVAVGLAMREIDK